MDNDYFYCEGGGREHSRISPEEQPSFYGAVDGGCSSILVLNIRDNEYFYRHWERSFPNKGNFVKQEQPSLY